MCPAVRRRVGGYRKYRSGNNGEGLLVSSCRCVSQADGIDGLEKAGGIGPDAEILAEFFIFTAGRLRHRLEESLVAGSPRLSVGHGVVERDGPLQMVTVHTPKGLPQAHLVTMHIAPGIEPGSVVKTV